MHITKEKLDEWKNVNIKDVDAKDLIQLKDININPNDPQEKRISDYIDQTKNPYFVAVGKYVFKFSNSDKGDTFENCFMNYLNGV